MLRQVRVYLTSVNLGPSPQRILEIVPAGARVAVVVNAWDADADAGSRAREALQLLALFASLGLDGFELDLREHFSDTTDRHLRARLAGVDLVFAHGGSSFVLRRAMRASRLDVVLRELVAADRVAYGGESAGAIVAGPTLRGLELGDDPNVVPSGYDPTIEWSGLGLVDFVPLPHADTDWWAESAARVRDAMARAGVSSRLLGDDDVVVVAGRTPST